MAHDEGVLVDDDRVHEGHIGTIVEIVTVIDKGKRRGMLRYRWT